MVLKKVNEAFKSFFGKIGVVPKKENKIPHYLEKDNLFELEFPSSRIKIQKDGTFNVPMSPTFKKKYVNGALNILKKSNHPFDLPLMLRLAIKNPKRIKIA